MALGGLGGIFATWTARPWETGWGHVKIINKTWNYVAMRPTAIAMFRCLGDLLMAVG